MCVCVGERRGNKDDLYVWGSLGLVNLGVCVRACERVCVYTQQGGTVFSALPWGCVISEGWIKRFNQVI